MKKYRLLVAPKTGWTPGLVGHNQNLNVQLADNNEQSTPENSMGPTLFNILINDLDDGKVPTDNTRLCGMNENKKQSFSSQEP